MSDTHEDLSTPGFYYYEELHSTNSQLKQLLSNNELEEMSIVMTAFQTAGRGQVGNSWESEKGKNILMSLLLKPHFIEIQQQFALSQCISLAVADTLEAFGIENVKVKWPNDIYIDNKKVAGILIENNIKGALLSESIVGIGLNVNQTTFVSNAPNPVSMAQVIGTSLELTDLFEKLMAQITCRYEQLINNEFETIDREYKAKMWRADNQLYAFKDTKGTFQAKIEGVNSIGQLCLLLPDGEKRVYGFKEVEYIK